ncbi:hypothetical protein AB9K26_00625 [Psychroserpens sp. XS_ASV72]|uniref:hypothetical protein n=1 Tax=Psychroserpens sp. XS_ASV72 TaxID=3241293 RepID=UPI0035151AFE
MKKIIVVLILSTIGFTSCIKVEEDIKKIKIAEQFYDALNTSEKAKIEKLITSKFTTIDDGFEQIYSQGEFAEWMRWDSVFEPTYEVLEIEINNGVVKTKISKTDKRISFLHNEPIVTEEVMQFDKNKIMNVNRNSIVFDVPRFVKNRDELIIWIRNNHPDLDGFINNQTESGGLNYLKAIELYKNKD